MPLPIEGLNEVVTAMLFYGALALSAICVAILLLWHWKKGHIDGEEADVYFDYSLKADPNKKAEGEDHYGDQK